MSFETKTVERDDDGIRLDRWFKRHYPAIGHALLEKLLRTGQVRVDGKRAKSGDRVARGQVLRLPPQVQTAPARESKSSTRASTGGPQAGDRDKKSVEDFVIYMDSSVLVLNKPAGLATQGGSGIREHVDGLLEHLMFEKKQKPKLVHRLDKDTSGVLVVARSASVAATLSESLRLRTATKIYWALTKGVPNPPSGRIKSALAKEGGFGARGRDERMAAVEEDSEGAKFAVTDYIVLGQAGEEFAWVAVKPVTGRMHQIRVHLASIGTPIVGDFKYGGTDVRGRGAVENKLHLHARSIDIAHPGEGRLQVTAPLPKHMLRTWALLGFDPDTAGNPFLARKRK